MKNRVLLAAVTAVAVTVNPCTGEAEDRPTRTASDGSQVVDYIAELESDVDSLKRQVTALENELSHKNDLLEQSGGAARRPVVAETDRSAELSKDLTEARQRLAEQSERLLAQYARLTEQSKKISELTETVESQKSLATHHESSDSDLKQQLEKRARALQVQEAKLRQVEAEREALTARLAEISNREKDLQSRMVQVEERAKAAQSHQTTLRQVEAEKASLAVRLGEASAREKDLQSRLAQIEERSQAAQSHETMLRQAQVEKGALTSQVAEHVTREKELRAKMATLEAALLEERKRGEQIAQARENEGRLIKAQADLNGVIESQKILLARQDSYTRELEARLKQQTETLDLQRAKLNEAESQRGALEVQVLTASAREQELTGRMRELKAAVAQDQRVAKTPSVISSRSENGREEELKKGQQLASIAPSVTQDVRLRATVPLDKGADKASSTIASGVRGELNAVRAQFSQRDKLFADYASSKPALIVNPAKAVSRRGETLSDLETALMNATNPRDAARMRQSLEEIKRALDEDIKLIQRLNRK